MLAVKRIQVVAEDDEFIDYDEEANRAAAQSDERKLLGKLLTGQESLKRKLVDLSVSNRGNFKKQRKIIKGVQKRVDRVVLYNTRSINIHLIALP